MTKWPTPPVSHVAGLGEDQKKDREYSKFIQRLPVFCDHVLIERCKNATGSLSWWRWLKKINVHQSTLSKDLTQDHMTQVHVISVPSMRIETNHRVQIYFT